MAVVKQAWQQLAGAKSSISVDELLKRFNAAAHPRVVTREKKAETVLLDFTLGIKDYVEAGCVSSENFVKYYSDVNAVLPAEREAYFIELVLKSWGISPKAV